MPQVALERESNVYIYTQACKLPGEFITYKCEIIRR